MTEPDAVGPLEGVRVLDFTRVLAGPHAGRVFADLGADVIKVEPPAGDLTRFASPRANSLATYFVQQNTGKRNISLDMTEPEAVEVLLRLIEHVDVVVENFRPGVMDRMGLGYADASARNPRIVYASISGYGGTGPWTHRRAYATVIAAESGLTDMQNRRHDDQFVNDPWSHADTYTSLHAAISVLAALNSRHRTGRGQHIDIAMAQTMLYDNEHAHDELWDRPVDDDWVRSFQPGDYPVLTLGNGDRVAISGHPAERGTFQLFVSAMGYDDMLDDERFASVKSRLANFGAIVAEMRRWALTWHDTQAIEEHLARHGLAMGVVRTAAELADSEWAAHRRSTVRVSDRAGGTFRVPNAPWQFSADTVGVQGPPKYRGEDNRAVLSELLGLDDEALDRLTAAGVLSARVPDDATP